MHTITHLGQGLDGCRGRVGGVGCYLEPRPHVLPLSRTLPREARAQGREVSAFIQPGVGLSHKGEMNPESQSKLCNAGLKAVTFANGLKRSQ